VGYSRILHTGTPEQQEEKVKGLRATETCEKQKNQHQLLSLFLGRNRVDLKNKIIVEIN